MHWSSLLALTVLVLLLAPSQGGSKVKARCPTRVLKGGRVRIRNNGRVMRYVCNRGYQLLGNRYSTCLRGRWDSSTPVCIKNGCQSFNVPYGQVVETYRGAFVTVHCDPGYKLVGNQGLYCNGAVWNDTLPICREIGGASQKDCDFESENLCGWSHDTNQDFNWQRHNFATPSGHAGTGPSCDHTLGQGLNGHYMYLESSSHSQNDSARLYSPVFKVPVSENSCFKFWYHMFGQTTGFLNVYLHGKDSELLFSESGDHGDQWQEAVLPLPRINTSFQILIEGVVGSGYEGDIAIDDVKLTTGEECPVVPPTTSEWALIQSEEDFSTLDDLTTLDDTSTDATVVTDENISALDEISTTATPVSTHSSKITQFSNPSPKYTTEKVLSTLKYITLIRQNSTSSISYSKTTVPIYSIQNRFTALTDNKEFLKTTPTWKFLTSTPKNNGNPFVKGFNKSTQAFHTQSTVKPVLLTRIYSPELLGNFPRTTLKTKTSKSSFIPTTKRPVTPTTKSPVPSITKSSHFRTTNFRLFLTPKLPHIPITNSYLIPTTKSALIPTTKSLLIPTIKSSVTAITNFHTVTQRTLVPTYPTTPNTKQTFILTPVTEQINNPLVKERITTTQSNKPNVSIEQATSNSVYNKNKVQTTTVNPVLKQSVANLRTTLLPIKTISHTQIYSRESVIKKAMKKLIASSNPTNIQLNITYVTPPAVVVYRTPKSTSYQQSVQGVFSTTVGLTPLTKSLYPKFVFRNTTKKELKSVNDVLHQSWNKLNLRNNTLTSKQAPLILSPIHTNISPTSSSRNLHSTPPSSDFESTIDGTLGSKFKAIKTESPNIAPFTRLSSSNEAAHVFVWASVVLLILSAVLGSVCIVKRRTTRRTLEDDELDIRFLAPDEMLDFTLSRPDISEGTL